MGTIPINDTTPKNSYVATAGQTTFPYTYFVNQAGDLQVYVNQVQVLTGFTVTNLQEASGGNVVFDTGLDDGDVVVIVRCSIIERLSEFEASGAFFASAVNLEYTYGVVIDQDLRRKIQDALRLSDFETETVKMQIPSVAGNDGNLLRLVLDTDTGEYCWIFASPSDIFTASLPNGTPGTILGYGSTGEVEEYTAGPGITIDETTNTISSTGGGALTVEDEGTGLGTFTTLNFVGSAVTVTDAGSGEATITISGTGGGATLNDALFTSPTDFTPGVSTDLTLPSDPGNEANLWVYFNGIPQEPDCFSLSGTTLTFVNPIPTWVDKIFVKLGTTASIGVPGDDTVGLAQLASGTPNFLLGFDGSGDPTEIDPSTLGGTDLSQRITVEEQQTFGVDGQTLDSANGYEDRVLNTIVENTITGATLTSNTVSLPAGDYIAFAFAHASPAVFTNPPSPRLVKARLRDTTNNVTLANGSAEFLIRDDSVSNNAQANVKSEITFASFTLAGTADVNLQMGVSIETAMGGQGDTLATSLTEPNVYARLTLIKIG